MTTSRAFSAARPRLTLGTAALAALASAGCGAQADGIVVESTSTAYQVSDRIATGQVIRIETGEHVVILDQSGDLRRIATPGAVFEDGAGQSRARTAGDIVDGVATAANSIVAGVGDREELGAIRGAPPCDGVAVAPHASIACARNDPDARLEMHLLLDGDGRLSAGEPLRYTLGATVDLVTLCEVGASDGSWTAADGSPDTIPLRLWPNKLVLVPQQGAVGTALRAPAGVSILRCYGMDPQSYDLLAPHVPRDVTSQEARAMVMAFTQLRRGLFLETAVLFGGDAAAPQ